MGLCGEKQFSEGLFNKRLIFNQCTLVVNIIHMGWDDGLLVFGGLYVVQCCASCTAGV